MKASHEAGNDKPESHTKPQMGEVQAPAPRLPHERDESSDSQDAGQERPLIRKAHDDLAQGRTDTDRGTPMHDTYQRQKEAPHKKT